MILQIALVLLIFLFFFLTYMVTKNWRALHVVLLVAVFFTSIAFLFFAGFTLKTHATWRAIVNDQSRTLESELAELDELKYGPENEIEQTKASLQSERAALERAVIDRGRVWRDCTPQAVNFDPDTRLLQATLQIPPREAPLAAPAAAPPADPDADPAAAQPAPVNQQAAEVRHLMEEKIILYAFLELPADENDPNTYKVPAYYLGEYYITAVTPDSVTVRSVVPPGDVEVQAAQSRGGTWALYEVMPIDGHLHFADMDEQTLRDFLSPERTGLTQGLITQEQYDQMIQGYLRHGQPATDDDPPERKWVKVEFQRDHQVEVDAEKPNLLTTQNFDSQGKATNIQLQQGQTPTSFEAGDTVVMDFASATDLERLGIVKRLEEIYVRELRDYRYSFHNIYRRITDLEERIRNTDRDLAKANEVIGKIRSQIAYREQEKAKLTEDLAGFNDETEKIEAYLAKLTRFRNELNGRLSSLYQHNNLLETQLSEMQAGLAQEIEQRASRAVAEVGAGAQ